MTATNLLNAWAAAMGRACWQGGLVVLAVWMICRLLPTMPARFQGWFWRLAILKFGLVLLLPTLISLPLLPAPPVVVSEVQPITEMPVAAQQTPLGTEILISPKDSVQRTPTRTMELSSIRTILCFAWVLGVGWCLIQVLAAWYAAFRVWYRSRNCDAVAQLADQGKLFRLRKLPRLITVEGSGSPFLIGVLRPTIVIPKETLDRLTVSEQTMVLGHELAHIRRGDLFWSFIASIVRAVFFFHPLVWWSERQLKLTQELAADELAIAKQQHDPVGYGELLVSVVGKLGHRPLISTVSVATAGTVHSLARRLVAMTCLGRTSRKVVVGSGVLLALAVLLGLVPWQLVAAETKEKQPPPSAGEKKHTSLGKDQQPTDEQALPFEKLLTVSPLVRLPTPFSKTTFKRLVEEKSKELRQLAGKTFEGLFQVFHVNKKDGHVVVTGVPVVLIDGVWTSPYWEFQFLIDAPELKDKAVNLKGCIVKVKAKLQETPMYVRGRGSAKFSEVTTFLDSPHDSTTATSPAPQSNEKHSVAVIKKLGGRIWRERVAGLSNRTVVILDFGNTNVADTGLEYVRALTDLEDLDLTNTQVTDAGLKYLKGLPRLRRLNLNGTNVSDAGLEHLRGLTNLQLLVLWDTNVTDAGMKKLQEELPKCRILFRRAVSPAATGTDWVAALNPEQAKAVAEIKKLGGEVTVDERHLDRFVVGVNFERAPVTDAGLDCLKGLPHLRSLNLNHTSVTDAGLEHLKGLTNLQVLDLFDTAVTGVGLKHRTSLHHLDLGLTKVTDAGLESLKPLTQLQFLNLDGTQVTDSGLEHLKGLTNLHWVLLGGIKVSREGVKKLQQALPNCTIGR